MAGDGAVSFSIFPSRCKSKIVKLNKNLKCYKSSFISAREGSCSFGSVLTLYPDSRI